MYQFRDAVARFYQRLLQIISRPGYAVLFFTGTGVVAGGVISILYIEKFEGYTTVTFADLLTSGDVRSDGIPLSESDLLAISDSVAATLSRYYGSSTKHLPILRSTHPLDRSVYEIAGKVRSELSVQKDGIGVKLAFRSTNRHEATRIAELAGTALRTILESRRPERDFTSGDHVLHGFSLDHNLATNSSGSDGRITVGEGRSRPLGPSTFQIVVWSTFVSLLLGLTTAILYKTLQPVIHSSNDVRVSGDPIFISLPVVRDRRGVAARNRGRARILSIAPGIPGQHPFKPLLHRIVSMSGNSSPVVVDSPGRKEGKTLVALNTAILLAQSGRRILLIETSSSSSSLRYLNSSQDDSGLYQILWGEKSFGETVRRTSVTNLDYLPAGSAMLDMSLAMRETVSLLQYLSCKYDVIIVDGPGNASTEQTPFQSSAATRVLVCSPGSTTKKSIRLLTKQPFGRPDVVVVNRDGSNPHIGFAAVATLVCGETSVPENDSASVVSSGRAPESVNGFESPLNSQLDDLLAPYRVEGLSDRPDPTVSN